MADFLERLVGSTKIGRAMSDYERQDQLRNLAGTLGDANLQDPMVKQQALAQYGQASGDLGPLLGVNSNALPSAIQEYNFFKNLTPQEKASYLGVKRSNQIINTGNEQQVLNPLGAPVAQYPIQVSPDAQPTLKGEQTRAQEEAKINVETQAGLDKKGRDAVNTIDLVAEAEKYLPQATSGALDQAGNWVNRQLGTSTDRSQADKQLQVISAALTSNVPRFEGPQGVMDVELYKQAAGDVANPDVPAGDRQAALKTIKDLQSKYATGAKKPLEVTVRPTAEQARAELARRRAAKGAQ